MMTKKSITSDEFQKSCGSASLWSNLLQHNALNEAVFGLILWVAHASGWGGYKYPVEWFRNVCVSINMNEPRMVQWYTRWSAKDLTVKTVPSITTGNLGFSSLFVTCKCKILFIDCIDISILPQVLCSRRQQVYWALLL